MLRCMTVAVSLILCDTQRPDRHHVIAHAVPPFGGKNNAFTRVNLRNYSETEDQSFRSEI